MNSQLTPLPSGTPTRLLQSWRTAEDTARALDQMLPVVLRRACRGSPEVRSRRAARPRGQHEQTRDAGNEGLIRLRSIAEVTFNEQRECLSRWRPAHLRSRASPTSAQRHREKRGAERVACDDRIAAGGAGCVIDVPESRTGEARSGSEASGKAQVLELIYSGGMSYDETGSRARDFRRRTFSDRDMRLEKRGGERAEGRHGVWNAALRTDRWAVSKRC